MMQKSPTAIAPKPVGRQRKFERLCAQIRDLADRLGPGAKMPTMLELRDSLGVSVATLSSVLGELEASNVISRRHGVGIYVSSRLRQKAICLICAPDFFRGGSTSPFWDLLVEQARRRAEAKDEAFSFHLSQPYGSQGVPLQDGLVSEVLAGRVDGILCLGVDRQAADWLTAQNVPTVVFAGSARWSVNLDGLEGVRLGVRELKAQGGRKLGLWSPAHPPRPGDVPEVGVNETAREFEQALADSTLPFEPRFIQRNLGRANLTKQEQGYHTAIEMFGADETGWPDAVYISDDLMTQGVLPALQKLGVQVGRDVRIATHANTGSPVLLGQQEHLTLIEIDPAEVVGEMFAMLEPLMTRQTPAQSAVLVKPKVHRPNSGGEETRRQ